MPRDWPAIGKIVGATGATFSVLMMVKPEFAPWVAGLVGSLLVWLTAAASSKGPFDARNSP